MSTPMPLGGFVGSRAHRAVRRLLLGAAAAALLGVICIPAASAAAGGTDPSVSVGSGPDGVAVDPTTPSTWPTGAPTPCR